MKIYFDNVDFRASNGPNNYATKLARKMTQLGHTIVGPADNPDAQISFIQTINKVAPTLLRLDGIYFNSEQDWKSQNAPIKRSYDAADAVVVQSQYDLGLIEHHFGSRAGLNVIHNGTCHDLIQSIEPPSVSALPKEARRFNDFWMCAAHWRPHKRLEDNVRYFEEKAPQDAALLIFGKIDSEGTAKRVADISSDRVLYFGERTWASLISVMKLSSTFLHLAWLDHCPNVVVDALASGCHLVCSTAGGTNEIPASTGREVSWTEIQDEETYGPCKLYEPPRLNIEARKSFERPSSADDWEMKDAQSYIDALKSIA